MRLAKLDVVCGLEASRVRALMRGMSQRNSPVERVAELLSCDQPQAELFLHALEGEGFVARDSEHSPNLWSTTIKGNALAQATFTKPIKREKAERLLDDVLLRASEYNADPTRLLSVVEIRVFGSFTRPEVAELGDLDLAVRYAERNKLTFWEDMQRQAHAESSPSSISAEIMYPLKNLVQRLKQRSRFIKITTEDIELFTDSWSTVYSVDKDPNAIQLTETHVLVEQD